MSNCGEMTSGTRHAGHVASAFQKRRAARGRRRDERAAIREERDPRPRHTKGWAD